MTFVCNSCATTMETMGGVILGGITLSLTRDKTEQKVLNGNRGNLTAVTVGSGFGSLRVRRLFREKHSIGAWNN